MTKPAKEQNPEDRRKFERVDIAHQAQLLVIDAKRKKTGVLRQLARGGFMMEPEKTYSDDNKIYGFTIHDPSEDMDVPGNARLRFSDQQYAGFEFIALDPDPAWATGRIVGTNHSPPPTCIGP